MALLLAGLLLLALSLAPLHGAHHRHTAGHDDSGGTCLVCGLVKGHCGVPVIPAPAKPSIPVLVLTVSEPAEPAFTAQFQQLPATRAPPLS